MEYPKFSFEVPIPNLDDFREHQDYTFALSFLLEDKRYSKYVTRQIQDGQEVIIDNSANELVEPESVERMVQIYRAYEPTAIVAPDDDSWGVKELMQNYEQITAKIGPGNVFGVARTWEEISAFAGLSPARLAIPYESRCVFSLSGIYLSFEVHFLGLNNPRELLEDEPYSVDTSMPIKLALQGLSITDWVQRACPHIHTLDLMSDKFFYTKMTTTQVHKAIKNIYELKEVTLGCLNALTSISRPSQRT